VRHVVVAPGADLGDLRIAHDVRRRRVASRGGAAEATGCDVAGVVLFCGCDEIDDVDEAMAHAAARAVRDAAADDALGADAIDVADAAFARDMLLRCWRAHADGLAALRAGTRALWRADARSPAAWASLAARGLHAAVHDGSRQDGLDLVIGKKSPVDALYGAEVVVSAHERVDLAYLKAALAVGCVAVALKTQAGATPPFALLKQALLTVLAGIVLTFYARFYDGSLATAVAAVRRFDDH